MIVTIVFYLYSTVWRQIVPLVPPQIFPRASAYGERLWSNPSTGFYEAETRILEHRRRLVDRGVRADALQPGKDSHERESRSKPADESIS